MILNFSEFESLNESFKYNDVVSSMKKKADMTLNNFKKDLPLVKKFIDIEKYYNDLIKWSTTEYLTKNFRSAQTGIGGKKAAEEVVGKILEISKKSLDERSKISKIASKAIPESLIKNSLKSPHWSKIVIRRINYIMNVGRLLGNQIPFEDKEKSNVYKKTSKWEDEFKSYLEKEGIEKIKTEIERIVLSSL